VAVAIGGNEQNAWNRRERDMSAPELEGVIRYSGFKPVFYLDKVAQETPAAVPRKEEGTSLDAWARAVFLRAWDKVFPGVAPTDRERQIIMAIGRHEGRYGKATKPAAWIGSNNWGAVQCGQEAPCGEKCFETTDKRRDGTIYHGCFRKYPTPEDGAQHLIELVTQKRPHVWAAIKSGTLLDVATNMGREVTIDGKVYKIYHESNPAVYGQALERNLKELANALGEPLSVGTALAVSSAKPAPKALTMQEARRAYPTRGLNLLVAQRRPELAQVFVGAPIVNLDEMRLRLRDLEAMWRPHAQNKTPVVGISTNLTVLDRANRLNDYINALHAIQAAESQKHAQPDGFPFPEWAAFRVSWSEVYFEITHGFVLWFADTVVSEYDELSRKWADIIAQHYGRRPETPTVDKPVKSGSGLLWFVGGTAVMGGLFLFLRRK
jgi:hypothetical protein